MLVWHHYLPSEIPVETEAFSMVWLRCLIVTMANLNVDLHEHLVSHAQTGSPPTTQREAIDCSQLQICPSTGSPLAPELSPQNRQNLIEKAPVDNVGVNCDNEVFTQEAAAPTLMPPPLARDKPH